MIILKAIGAFFMKIWRWIKDTAWVQPLLIVGTIFAIIFSIPYITSWAGSWSGTSTNAFYNAKKKTLEGEAKDTTGGSQADKLTQSIYANRETQDSTKYDLSYGTKFFLIYANSTNSTSNTYESAFKYLSDNWGNGVFKSDDANPFNYYTIFSDDTSSNDSDTEIAAQGTAFERYLRNNIEFFNTSLTELMAAPYYINANMTEDNYDKFTFNGYDASKTLSSQFVIPSVCLVDYSETAIAQGRQGLSEILFTVSGETDGAKAQTLLDMWNHTSSDADNKFSSTYLGS